MLLNYPFLFFLFIDTVFLFYSIVEHEVNVRLNIKVLISPVTSVCCSTILRLYAPKTVCTIENAFSVLNPAS